MEPRFSTGSCSPSTDQMLRLGTLTSVGGDAGWKKKEKLKLRSKYEPKSIKRHSIALLLTYQICL